MQPETEAQPESALLAAALSCAGETERESEESPKGGPAPAPEVTPEQLVALCEWVRGFTVDVAARAAKLPPGNPRVRELQQFEPAQREMLLLFAPGAVPMFKRALPHAEKIAGVLFAVAFAGLTMGALREVRSLAAIYAMERAATSPASSSAAAG